MYGDKTIAVMYIISRMSRVRSNKARWGNLLALARKAYLCSITEVISVLPLDVIIFKDISSPGGLLFSI